MTHVRRSGSCPAACLAALLLLPALAGATSPEADGPAPAGPPARPSAVPVRNAARTPGLYTVGHAGPGVYYCKGYVLGVGVHVVEADLSDPEVRVAAMVARGGIGSEERFGQMVRRARPAAAITGTFFGIRSRIPTGDLVIAGRHVFRGFIGTAVAITPDGQVEFISTRRRQRGLDWSRYETVIRGGPRLVACGRISMTAWSEGFRALPLRARRPRTAVGLTRDGRLQLVAVRQGITMWELAKLMRAIGARDAVALDGGTSTALYFAGRFVARPGRELTNLLLIYHRKSRLEAMRREITRGVPPAPRRRAFRAPAPAAAAPSGLPSPALPPADLPGRSDSSQMPPPEGSEG